MKTIYTLKKYGIMFFLSLLLGLPAIAQKKPAELRAKDETDMMTCELKLYEGQQIQQVYNINLHAAKQMDSLSSRYRMNISALLNEGKEVDRKRDVALQDVLTPMQWSRFERFRKDSEAGRISRREATCRKPVE